MNRADEILNEIQKAESKKLRGKLKIFFGMCAGVGKTYAMLVQARELVNAGRNVLVGYAETHGRTETAELLSGLKVLPRKSMLYNNIKLEEFDLERTLELHPEFVLVDELAHTNVPDSKHEKRYQDVLELLDNGINVFTTVNVQHIESRSKTVEQITGVPVRETVPDSVIELADDIEVIDLPIEELLKRMSEGKVYVPEKAALASKNFFKEGNLISLREMALRLTAEKVEGDLVDYMSEKNIPGPWKAGDRILVAVGSSPFSAELIRRARRIAYNLKSKWFAVYVRTGNNMDEETEKSIEKNLRLAKELGAEVITTADTDLVSGLLDMARRNNVAQIIIGKPAKYGILNYFKKDNYIDRLISESGDIDIFIVRPERVTRKDVKKSKSVRAAKSNAKEYAYVMTSILLVSLICWPFKEYMGYQTVGLLLLFNLIILPFFVGRGPIIAGAILNSVIWNYFFIPPLFTFEIAKFHDVMTLVLNFVVALTGGFLTTKIKIQKELVRFREKNNLASLDFTKDLAVAKSRYEAIQITLSHIDKNIGCQASFFGSDLKAVASSRANIELSEKERSIAQWSMDSNKQAGKFSANLPESICRFLPVSISEKKIGVIGLYLTDKLSIESENLVGSFITQMCGIYEKELSRELLQKVELSKESDRLYDTLIDSISHEFRTPIAVISGASSVLFEDKIAENPELVGELANEIYFATKRMDSLVENLLNINRLEAGKLTINGKMNSINDLISETADNLKPNKGNRKIDLQLDAKNTNFMFDYGFVGQAIYNILQNACFYTPDGSVIEIKTEFDNESCKITISDNGPGVPEEQLPKLFDKFYRVKGTKSGGTGLGLSISKGFITAHKGTIRVLLNKPSGLIFEIIFPL